MTENEAIRFIKAAKQGDESALLELHTSCLREMRRRIAAMLYKDEDALEVASEAVYQIWRSALSFKEQSSALTWMTGIARNRAKMKLRSLGRVKEFGDENYQEWADSEITDNLSPIDVVALAQNKAIIQQCLNKLSEVLRKTLQMTFLSDMSEAEVAERMSCPIGTVKSRKSEAKQRLKSCLKAFGLQTSYASGG